MARKKKEEAAAAPKAEAIKNPMAADGRARVWLVLLFPDGMVDNWRDKIQNTHSYEWALSPLHTPANNPMQEADEEGHEGKQHYHLMITFKGKQSAKQVQWLVDELFKEHAPRVEAALSKAQSYAYLAHYGFPTKEQFEGGLKSITHSVGFAAPQVYADRLTARAAAEWIADNEICSFQDLLSSDDDKAAQIWRMLSSDKALYSWWQTEYIPMVKDEVNYLRRRRLSVAQQLKKEQQQAEEDRALLQSFGWIDCALGE